MMKVAFSFRGLQKRFHSMHKKHIKIIFKAGDRFMTSTMLVPVNAKVLGPLVWTFIKISLDFS
jgi:hypothetical protein